MTTPDDAASRAPTWTECLVHDRIRVLCARAELSAVALLIAFASTLSLVARPSFAGEATFFVNYHEDRLSVRLRNASVGDVIAEIARQSGAQIRGVPAGARTLLATFDAITLSEGLHRLLRGQSFLLVYRADGRLVRLELLSDEQVEARQREWSVPHGSLEDEPGGKGRDQPGLRPIARRAGLQSSGAQFASPQGAAVDLLSELSSDPERLARARRWIDSTESDELSAQLEMLFGRDGPFVHEEIVRYVAEDEIAHGNWVENGDPDE